MDASTRRTRIETNQPCRRRSCPSRPRSRAAPGVHLAQFLRQPPLHLLAVANRSGGKRELCSTIGYHQKASEKHVLGPKTFISARTNRIRANLSANPPLPARNSNWRLTVHIIVVRGLRPVGWVRKTATHPLVLLHIFSSPHAAHATRGKPRGDERHVQTVQVGRFHQKERVREEVEKHATNFLERNYEEIVSYLFGFSKN